MAVLYLQRMGDHNLIALESLNDFSNFLDNNVDHLIKKKVPDRYTFSVFVKERTMTGPAHLKLIDIFSNSLKLCFETYLTGDLPTKSIAIRKAAEEPTMVSTLVKW